MKITIITTGSRGDVEPFVALGEGLRQSGHAVTIASETRFQPLITGHGLTFAPVAGDTHAAINSDAGQKILQQRNNTQAFYTYLIDDAAPFARQILEQCINACQYADHIITAPYYIYPSYFISQLLSKPMSLAGVNAVAASHTRSFHNLLFPPPGNWWPAPAQKLYNGLSHKAIRGLMWQSIYKVYGKAWFDITGTSFPKNDPYDTAFGKNPPLSLYGYSPSLLPKPADWKPNQHVTGYWFLKPDLNWAPSSELENFLHSGPPPIYIGFGSMNNSSLKNGSLEKLILEVVDRTKQRAVILKQGLNFDQASLPSHVFAADPVPFTYLFPKMSTVVHHGGAGTIATALLAGIPSISTPLIVDQKFWAWRAHQSGIGSEPITWHDLSAEKLADAIISTLANSTLRSKVQEIAKKIADEQGVENAVSIFNQTHTG